MRIGGALTVGSDLTATNSSLGGHLDLPHGWRILVSSGGSDRLQFRHRDKPVLFPDPDGTLASLIGELKVGG